MLVALSNILPPVKGESSPGRFNTSLPRTFGPGTLVQFGPDGNKSLLWIDKGSKNSVNIGRLV